MISDKVLDPSFGLGDPPLRSAEELRRLARRLLKVADALELAEGEPAPAEPPRFDDEVLMRTAQAVYRARQRRGEFFDDKLIGEPAWDMLLDLFIHSVRGQVVSTTSLCIASCAAPTTALRWIAVLEQADLVERRPDAVDDRLKLVHLTPKGFKAMRRWLTDWLRG